MKIYFLLSLLICSVFYSQDRLSFVNDEGIKKQIQNSIEFLKMTKVIPTEIKNKIIFITFDIEKLPETEELGFNYSTTIPLSWANMDENGQLISKFIEKQNDEWMFFNYSTNVILVFRGSLDYFDINKMKKLSTEVHIKEKKLVKSEYFSFNKGDEFLQSFPKNNFAMKRINGQYIPIYVSTFDLKTFMEVWYGLDVNEIPVTQSKKNKK